MLFAYLRAILRASMHFLVLLVASLASIYQTLSAISAMIGILCLKSWQFIEEWNQIFRYLDSNTSALLLLFWAGFWVCDCAVHALASAEREWQTSILNLWHLFQAPSSPIRENPLKCIGMFHDFKAKFIFYPTIYLFIAGDWKNKRRKYLIFHIFAASWAACEEIKDR